MNFGDTADCAIDTAGQVQSSTFVAATGDRLLVRVIAPSGSMKPSIAIERPDLSVLCSQTGGYPAHVAEIQSCLADVGGTFTLNVSGASSTTGQYSVYLQRPNNAGNATAAAYGTAYDGSLASAAQMDTYTVSASTGDHMLARMTEPTGSYYPDILIYRPDGTLLCNSSSPYKAQTEVQSCAADQKGELLDSCWER